MSEKCLLALLTLWCLLGAAPAGAGSFKMPPLLAAEERLNDACRGWSGDLPSTSDVCDARTVLVCMLDQAGWCFGKATDKSESEKKWHLCEQGSQHIADASCTTEPVPALDAIMVKVYKRRVKAEKVGQETWRTKVLAACHDDVCRQIAYADRILELAGHQKKIR